MPKEIIIVDDEPGVVVPIQSLMEQQGYLVMIAERGEDALDLIYRYKPDLSCWTSCFPELADMRSAKLFV